MSDGNATQGTVIRDLEEALPLGKDAIASRPLMDLAGSTKVVLFAMDAGQELSAHSAPFPALVHLLEGSIDLMVDGTWTKLSPGVRAPLPKGLPHGLKALEPSRFLLLMFRGAGA